jgi:hypothetical protein
MMRLIFSVYLRQKRISAAHCRARLLPSKSALGGELLAAFAWCRVFVMDSSR